MSNRQMNEALSVLTTLTDAYKNKGKEINEMRNSLQDTISTALTVAVPHYMNDCREEVECILYLEVRRMVLGSIQICIGCECILMEVHKE